MFLYLDHNATTTTPKGLLQEYFQLLSQPLNPSATHSFGRRARQMLEQARNTFAKKLGCSNNNSFALYFTSGCTESNNTIINSFLLGAQKAGLSPVFLILASEHSSIYQTCDNACKQSYAKNAPTMKAINTDKDGLVDMNHLQTLLSEYKGKEYKIFVSISYVNNETGVIQPMTKIRSICSSAEAFLHSDITQAIGKISVSVPQIADSVSFSCHKFGGICGVGGLIVNENLHGLSPTIHGGGQESSKRSGTQNVAAIYISAKAVDKTDADLQKFVSEIGILKDLLESKIVAAGGIIVSNSVKRVCNTSAIIMPDVENTLQLIEFDSMGIAVSIGSACSSGKISVSKTLKAMGIPEEVAKCAIRVSLGAENTKLDIETFVKAWIEIYTSHKKRRFLE